MLKLGHEFRIDRNVYVDIIIHPCLQINDGLANLCFLNKSIVPEHISRNKFIDISYEITLRLMPQDTYDDESTLLR